KMAAGAAAANLDASGLVNLGAGTHAAFSYTNDPNYAGASTIITSDATNIPSLAIERSAVGGNPSNQSNQTLFVGTHLNPTVASSWSWGINNEMQIDHNAAPGG